MMTQGSGGETEGSVCAKGEERSRSRLDAVRSEREKTGYAPGGEVERPEPLATPPPPWSLEAGLVPPCLNRLHHSFKPLTVGSSPPELSPAESGACEGPGTDEAPLPELPSRLGGAEWVAMLRWAVRGEWLR